MAGEKESGDGFNGRLRLFVGNRAIVNRPINVVAFIRSTDPRQTVTLKLPDGLTLLPGQSPTQTMPPPSQAGYSQVTWRVTSAHMGVFQIQADAPNIGIVSQPIRVRGSSLFD